MRIQVRPQYTYRVFLSRSGRGGAARGAQGGGGWGGEVNLPQLCSATLTRRPQGSADFGGHFGVHFGVILGAFWNHFGSVLVYFSQIHSEYIQIRADARKYCQICAHASGIS